MKSHVTRLLPAVLLVLLLALAVAAARGPGVTGETLPPPTDPVLAEWERQPTPGGVPQPEPTAAPTDQPKVETPLARWLGNLVTALILLLAGGTVVLLCYYAGHYLLTERVQRKAFTDVAASQPDHGMVLEELRDLVRASLADLDSGGDPRRVVIACWLRLERLAAAAGTHRLAADTPADLVERLLAGHRVDGQSLQQLADAYRLARYAPATVGPELVAVAQEALRAIDAQLRIRRRVGPET